MLPEAEPVPLHNGYRLTCVREALKTTQNPRYIKEEKEKTTQPYAIQTFK